MNLLGHVMRLPNETPIKIAFNENLKKNKSKVGRPKHTLATSPDDREKINKRLDLQDEVPLI